MSKYTAPSKVHVYAQRMRLEQSFRGARNLRLGFGLSGARPRGVRRLEMLLLIHSAGFVPLLIGQSLRRQQLKLHFQTRC